MALTKRQKEVLDYLVSFETKHGYAPSFEEIGKGMKLTSLATVHKHISTLEKKGFIRRGYNQSRSIEIVQLPKSVKEQVIERQHPGTAAGGTDCSWPTAGSGGRARDTFAGRFRARRQFLRSAGERQLHD